MMKARNELWILCFLGFGVNYMLRININIAIVDMVAKKQQSPYPQGNWSETSVDGESLSVKNHFHWDEYEQNLILSSYYWAQWMLQLPGGIIAHRYGAKHTIGFNNLLVALLTFLVPLTASYGVRPLAILRALQGFIAGSFWTAMPSMVSKWVPPKERGTFVSAYLGSSVGTAFTYFLCGYLIEWFGWEYAFYVTAVLGVLWWISWVVRVHETPQKHSWISKEEREYIEQSLGTSVNRKNLPIPWGKILTSRAVWVNAIAQWGCNGLTFTLLTHTPTYLSYIHGLPITKNGLWSGISNLTKWIVALSFGLMAERQQCLSTTNVRKLATSIGTIVNSLLLYILAFTECDVVSAVIIISLVNTLLGTVPAGTLAGIIDMCPNFAGVIQGLVGTFGSTTGFIYPLLVGYLTQNNQTPAQWQKIFFIISTVALICGLIFMIFGTSEEQSWNTIGDPEKEMKILTNSKQVKQREDNSKKDVECAVESS